MSKQKPPLRFLEFKWADVSIEEEVRSGTFGSVFGSVKPEQMHYHSKLSPIHKAHGKEFYPKVELMQGNRDMMDDIQLQHLTSEIVV